MTTSLLRSLSFQARRLRLSHFNPSPSLLCLSQPTSFFSSRSDPHTQEKQQPLDVEDISNEEFKRRVARLQEGDAEAIPSVFEAILQRSLTGKPIEADQELMREILGERTGSEEDDDDDDEGDEFDSDLKGMSDTDYEDEEDFDGDFKPRSGANEEKTKPVFGTSVDSLLQTHGESEASRDSFRGAMSHDAVPLRFQTPIKR